MSASQLSCAAEPLIEGSGRRLLVVEDEYLLALTMTDLLSEFGYEVVGPAASIEEACRLATMARLDGALLDWNLGASLAGEVADILARRNIPFLFVTGYAEIPDVKYAKCAVLNKPFVTEDLRNAIQAMAPAGEDPARSTLS